MLLQINKYVFCSVCKNGGINNCDGQGSHCGEPSLLLFGSHQRPIDTLDVNNPTRSSDTSSTPRAASSPCSLIWIHPAKQAATIWF
ncbi:hypothetical protein L1887_41829 [Cichorium endivia]|nr:hypothetical protein L1887_41829 [Cichorium endivia]